MLKTINILHILIIKCSMELITLFLMYFNRFLATGLAFRQIAFSFRISKTAVSNIVVEVCKAIWKTLKCKHMPTPTVDTFKKIVIDFYDNWNFPNCAGSIDGKHIRLKLSQNVRKHVL